MNTDDAALRVFLERLYGMTGKDRIFDAVNVVAQERSFHPVRDYLNECTWDGVPSGHPRYLGAEDTVHPSGNTKDPRRCGGIYKPGCKFDYMLTLRGKQGLGKSALIAKLGGTVVLRHLHHDARQRRIRAGARRMDYGGRRALQE